MKEKILIRNLPDGVIIWKGNVILGVKGMTLKEKYYDMYCYKIEGNRFDYELYGVNYGRK